MFFKVQTASKVVIYLEKSTCLLLQFTSPKELQQKKKMSAIMLRGLQGPLDTGYLVSLQNRLSLGALLVVCITDYMLI